MTGTRQAILELLKQEGPLDARSLAARLGVTAMAVRQHLYALQGQRLVGYSQEPRPFGRPAKMWLLMPAAAGFFPDGHAELSVSLIYAAGRAFGPKGLAQLFSEIRRQQVEAYQRQVPARASLRRRLEALAAARTAEGYMAEVQAADDGSFLLIENHCPIGVAARAYPDPGLCRVEIEVFRSLLGPGVEVERTEHIATGARRCAYRVCAA